MELQRTETITVPSLVGRSYGRREEIVPSSGQYELWSKVARWAALREYLDRLCKGCVMEELDAAVSRLQREITDSEATGAPDAAALVHVVHSVLMETPGQADGTQLAAMLRKAADVIECTSAEEFADKLPSRVRHEDDIPF